MALSVRETQVLSQLAYMYLNQGFTERACLLYAALHLLQPEAPQHVRGIAVSNARAGRPDRALAALDLLALRGEVDAPYYSLRARVLGSLKRPDEAQAAMRSYLGLRASASVNDKSSRSSDHSRKIKARST